MNQHSDIDRVMQAWMANGPISMPDRVVGAVATRISRQPQRRARRLQGRLPLNAPSFKLAAVLAAGLIVAIVGWNVLPRQSSIGGPGPSPTPTPMPTPTPVPTPTASGVLPAPTIDVTAGVAHRMSPDAVQQVVLAQIATDEGRAGQRLATPRIILVRLMPAGTYYNVESGGMSADTTSWLVVYEGTVLGCGSTCDAFTGAAVLIDDATGWITSGFNSGHVGECIRTGETSCTVVRDLESQR